MKKLLIIVTLGVAGIMTANTTKMNICETQNSISLQGVKSDTNFLEALYSVYLVTSCGVPAVTEIKDATLEKIVEWAEKIEENYCGPNAPYSNTSGVY